MLEKLIAKYIQEGDVEKLKIILNSIIALKTELNESDHMLDNLLNLYGIQLCCTAIKCDNLEFLDFLLSFREKLGLHSKNISFLHYAAEVGNKRMVKKFLDEGADIDSYDKDNSTPLYLAAEYGHAEIVSLLIDKHANVNIKDDEGYTALSIGVNNGHKSVVELLLNAKAEVNGFYSDNGITLLSMAAYDKRADILELLLNAKADPNLSSNKNVRSPLFFAISAGDEPCVKLLIESNADVNHIYINHETGEDLTPLYFAALAGQTAIVKQLIDANATINHVSLKNGSTALHAAAAKGHTEIVQLLINNKADVNLIHRRYKCSALYFAVTENHEEIVKLLVPLTTNFNNIENNETLLFKAAESGNIDTIKLLLKAGAKVDLPCADGVRPIHVTLFSGDVEILEILLDAGSDVNLKDKGFNSLLQTAIKQKNEDIALTLIKRGANIYEIFEDLDTLPLNFACKKKLDKVVTELLNLGAGIFAKLEAIPEAVDLTNKVVIGLKLNGVAVSRNTRGFEKAITNSKELLVAINHGVTFNQKAISNRCKELLKIYPKDSELKQLKINIWLNKPDSLMALCLNVLNKSNYIYRACAIHNEYKVPNDLQVRLNPDNDDAIDTLNKIVTSINEPLEFLSKNLFSRFKKM